MTSEPPQATPPDTVMTRVVTADGVRLAVHRYTEIDPTRPTILAIHGYPDNHHVWDGVAEQLEAQHPGRYNIAAYDVRGAGDSSAPKDRDGYRLDRLVADAATVIDELRVNTVHLLGHDWGSIQGWTAITDPALTSRIASFTSISGPQLDYVGAFLRSPRGPRALFDVAKQLATSSYLFFFLTPRLPEALFASRFGRGLIEKSGRIGQTSTRTRHREAPRAANDYTGGLNLYRANMPRPMFLPADPLPRTTVPTQVLIPRRDVFVGPAVQRFASAICDGGRALEIEGGHWVVSDRPDVIAGLTADWIEQVLDGPRTGGTHAGGA